MRKYIGLWTILIITALVSGAALTAQNETNSNLRIAFVSNRLGNEDIYLMTQDGERGTISNLTNNPARDWKPTWSPQGDRIIFNSNRDGRDTLYIMNADGTGVRPLFPGETFNDYSAAWSPDGTQIIFTSDRGGAGRELFIAASDGSAVQQLTSDNRLKGDPVWSPDGQQIVYWEVQNNGEIHLFKRDLASDATPQLLTNAGPNNGAPAWTGDTIYFDTNREGENRWYIYRMASNGNFPERVSTQGVNSGRVSVAPDGSQFAFVTERDGNDEIYVVNADGSSLRRLTDNRFSDHSPAWQPAVPQGQIEPTPQPTLAAEPASGGESSFASVAVGQSVSGVVVRPISTQQLLIDYGISAWHEAGWTGAGQRIGVIDTAFGGLADFVARSGDVLRPPNDSLTAYSDDLNSHGTNVLKVIHAVAPNASLYACRYNGTLVRLKDCVDWLIKSGVKVINHSVGLPILPINGQSEWDTVVNNAFAKGILWVNSAGNFNQGYLRDNYQDRNNDNYHNFVFGNQERELVVNVGGPYTGTILLSWLEGDITLFNPQTGFNERINLDLEIVSASTLEVLNPTQGRTPQNLDPNLSPVEVVRLVDVRQPFAIRVRNAGAPLNRQIEFTIFVEFAPLEADARANTGSVVVPADAAGALTVGSVNGVRELADYSSRGLNIADYQKPDIAAPGEFIMDDGSTFIGTSAAAPVVSGIAALLLEQNPALTPDQLPRAMRQIWIDPRPSLAFGAGIIQLGPPPSSRIGDRVVDTPPRTVFPQPDEVFVDQGIKCSTRLGTRFEVGMPGYVNYDLGLAIRADASQQATQLATLQFGDQFEVVEGPRCASGMFWWNIQLGTGATGWVGEGFNYYLITPVNIERALLPVTFNTVCPHAPTSLLAIGDQARILRSNQFFFRGLGARNERGEMRPLPADTIVQLLGGPVCEGDATNILRWYVRVISGPRAGYEGWVQEGITDERQMLPVSQ